MPRKATSPRFDLTARMGAWVVEGQSASLADLPDLGSTGLGISQTGIYQIGARQSVGGRGVGWWAGRRHSETLIGSAIVAMAAAIVTIANVVIAAVVEPQQSSS